MFISISPDDDPARNRFRAFEGDLADGDAYFRRAREFAREEDAYALVFNVASMALERYLVAVCHLHNVEPCNHNYVCLMDAAQEVEDFDPRLNKSIRWLDESIFGICSLDNYHHGTPRKEDADLVLDLCRQVRAMITDEKIERARAELGL